MKVQELIEQLQDMNPDAEVRIAYQPNWPLQALIAGVIPTDENGAPANPESDLDSDQFFTDESGNRTEQIVYLTEGGSTDNPHANSDLWATTGW